MRVRRPLLDFTHVPAVWAGDRGVAAVLNAGGALAPAVEPYVNRVMRAAARRLGPEHAELIERIGVLVHQETEHYRLHTAFNQALYAQGYTGLEPIIDDLKLNLARQFNDRPFAFNLAWCVGFETFTLYLGQFLLGPGAHWLEGAAPEAAALWRWHLAEEYEHRAVCHDAYRILVGDYALRLRTTLHVHRHVGAYRRRALAVLSEDARPAFGRVMARAVLVRLPPAALPYFDPEKASPPPGLRDALDAYPEARMIETRRIVANGLNFAVDVSGAGDTVALCLHGFPEARQAWSEQLPALAGLGWLAAAPDLRGFGDSDRPKARDAYRLEHLVADAKALFEALGAKRRILIGHDWGGVIAWQVAIRRPDLLDGLVIVNAPHPTVYRRLLESGVRQRLRSWYVAFFQLPKLPELQLTLGGGYGLERALTATTAHFPAERLALYRSNVCKPGAATAMIDYYRANAVELGFGPLTTTTIRTPTLLVWGENDPYLDLALTQGNEAFVEDLTVRRLSGVSHWVAEDASPELNRTIADWGETRGLTQNPTHAKRIHTKPEQ